MLRFCWHIWSNWSEPKAFGYNWYQVRTCLKCGKMQQREIGLDLMSEGKYDG